METITPPQDSPNEDGTVSQHATDTTLSVMRDARDSQAVGLMFWFSRNRLVGSYLFFSATSRP